MATRANILIKDDTDTLYFYRHWDGYPDCVLSSLETFLTWLKEGKIRDNVTQAAGWLIILGANEYKRNQMPGDDQDGKSEAAQMLGDLVPGKPLNDWKVGAYEPTTGIHGDVEYIYTVDLKRKQITWKRHENAVLNY
jgi:hypothetical protein